jgi:glucose dehydrogenase
MGYSNQRYSPLKDINRGNAGKLQPVWAYSLNNPQGQESQPLIYQGVMYITTSKDTIALDPITGKQLWKQDVDLPQDVFKYACCGIINHALPSTTASCFVPRWTPMSWRWTRRPASSFGRSRLPTTRMAMP